MTKPFHMLVAKLRKGYLEYDKEALDQLGINILSNQIDYIEGIKMSERLIREK